jgi:hypothetical protein
MPMDNAVGDSAFSVTSKTERDLSWYKSAVMNGLRFQRKYAKSQMWAQYKAYYRHEFPSGTLPVNLVFSILRSIVPQVYFRDPSVIVTPTKPGLEFQLHARLIQDLDKWMLLETGVKYQIKKLINDSFLCGIASGFVGYDSEYGFSQSKTIGAQGQASLTQFNKSGNRIEYNNLVNPGMPWFLRARPEDVVYPWGCESSVNAEWVAMRVFRPLSDIKSDPKYKNTDKLKGSYTQRRTQPEGGMRDEWADGEFKDHEWVELWQLRDAKTKEIVCFTMDHNEFLRKEEDLIQVDGIPVETLAFNPDPDFIYGIPDARIIEPQLLELNEIRTQAMKHRRVDLLKFLYRRKAVSDDQLAKLLSEDVQAGIAIDSEEPINQAIMQLQPGASAILADLERMGETIRGDVRETVGFSRSSTGEYQGKTHISAKETEVVNWANQIRVDERRDMVADLLQNVIRRYNQMIFTYWKEPIIRSIIGPDGARYWIKFSPADIKAEYTYKIDPTNAIPVDQRTKRQDAQELFAAWSQAEIATSKTGKPVPPELLRYIYSQYDGIDVDKMVAESSPPPAPPGQPPMGPGAGQNPDQALPPQEAARMMGQRMGM